MDRTPWDPEGVEIALAADGQLSPSASDEGLDLRELYKKLVSTRGMDLRLRRVDLPLFASSAGEEAASVSLGLCAEREDWLYASARDAGALLARGIKASTIAARILGNDGRPSLPGDLSMPEQNVVGSGESLGLHLLLATGHARAQALGGEGQGITMALFGEGTTTTGAFHEAMCMAAHSQLPIVFVCKSQMWPEGAPAEAGSLGDSAAERAQTYGMWTRRADGADAVGSMQAIRAACARARRNEGPAFVEVVVTQLAHNPPGHRDPVERLRRLLDQRGEWTQTFQDVIEAEVRGQLDGAIQAWQAEVGS